MISRRSLLSSVAPGVLLALTACQTVQKIAAAAAQDALTLASGLTGLLAKIGSYVPAPIVSAVGTAVAEIQAAATALQTAAAAGGQALVQTIESGVNSIIATLQGLNLPAPISTILQATATILPLIEAAVGMVVTAVTGTTPAATLLRASRPMPADEARSVLMAASVH